MFANIKTIWRRLFYCRSPAGASPMPRPDPPLCLIGDVHGRADLLDMMLALIAAEPQGAEARLVFVGDMIDRGPDSAGVLRRIHALCQADPERVTCLMGNHERMMLDFLAAPAGRAKRWLNAGGVATLNSFGLSSRQSGNQGQALHFATLSRALRDAMMPDLLPWITGLPLYWQGEGLAVVHADALPDRPMHKQPETMLLWGQKGINSPRSDGLWLAHGHVIMPQVTITQGRIALDTGAYRTGCLSAVWLDTKGARLIEAAL